MTEESLQIQSSERHIFLQKLAKIISFLSGFVYIYSFGYFLFVQAPKLAATYSEIEIGIPTQLPFYIGVFLGVVLTTTNFLYAFYLHNKGRNGQIIKNALVWSILLGPVAFFVYLGFLVFAIIWPIYSITANF